MNKITRELITSKIVDVSYTILGNSTTTICQLTLKNGYTVTGESACVDPRNFDIGRGQEYAYESAFNEIWALEGYLLKEKLYQSQAAPGCLGSFGNAIEALRNGDRVSRSGWNGKGLWLELQVPDAHSKMTLPYIFMSYPTDAKNTPGARVPWLASQTDMLANDWVVVD